MLHLDFNWDLSPNGIILDEELNTDRLGWQPGDIFVLEETATGKLIIKKQSGLRKMILEAAMEKEKENG